MRKLALVACCLLVCLLATSAMAANQVVVQSRTFGSGQTACTVGVFIDNDIQIKGLVLPLEIRTQSGTAFYLGNLIATVWNFTPTGRLKLSPLGDVADPNGLWPAGNVTRRQLADPVHVDSPQVCSGPIASSWAISAARGDTISPDGFLLATVSSGDPNIGEEIYLTPGTDGATPSLRFLMNMIPGQDGCIRIDTCCVTPANHLVYVDENDLPVLPSFTAGLLTVGSGSCAEVVNQPPTAICQDVQVAADGNCQGAVTAAQVNNGSNDAEDGTNLILSLTPAGPYPLGVTQVSLIVTDQGGLADTCVANVTVVDQTAPVISCPGDIVVQCGTNVPAAYANTDAFIAAGGTVSDNCGNAPVTLLDEVSDGNTCPNVITRRYVATDGAGNKDTCTQTITVDDTQNPVITDCPNDTVINLPNGQTSTVVIYSDAVISENCNSVNLLHNPLPGSTFNLGVTNVTLVVTDLCGNADTCTFTVTVNELPPVNTPPTAVCQDVHVASDANCEGNVTAAQVNNGSNDAEDGTNLVLALNPIGPYPNGVETQVWLIVTDQGGLKDSCQAKITITDSTAPSITCPSNVTVQCAADIPAAYDQAGFLSAGGTLDDNCGIGMFVLFDETDNGTCPRVIERTYRVMDNAGNVAFCTHTITVDDTTSPSITCPTDINATVSNGTTDTVIVYVGATGTDNCDQNIDYSYSHPSGGSFPVGVTVVTVVGTDDCGNADTCQFTITITEEVTEPVPPVAICSDVKVSADANCEANADINNGSFDPDGGSVTTSQNPAGPYPLGATLVLLTVTDDEGDEDTCSAWVTVNDVTPPVFDTCPNDIVVSNDFGECGAVVFFSYSAVDNCDQALTYGFDAPGHAPGDFFPVGVTNITIVATDDAGNADTCSFSITVVDNEPPVALCPGDTLSYPNDPGLCTAVPNFDLNGIGSTDNCSIETSVYIPAGNSVFPLGTTEVAHVVTDPSGNADTCYFIVNVYDTSAPTVTCSDDIKVTAQFGQTSAVVNYTSSATDCGGIQSLVCVPPSGSSFPIGQTLVTCTATDIAGNTTQCSFTVTVNEGSQTAPGPHVDVDTLWFKTSCGCDTQIVSLYCLDVDSDSCWYNAEYSIGGISVVPNPGWAPEEVQIIACGANLDVATYEGWIVFHDAPGVPTDSIYVIHQVNFDAPGIAVSPDTIEFTYTGDIFNDKLCLPAQIVSTGCGEVCWQLVGPSGDWVWVDPTSGNTPDEVEICVTPCSLQAGVYYQTVLFCVCPPTKGDEGDPVPVGICDPLVVKLNVVNPPVLVVDPLELHFDIKCDQKALPLPVYITNGGGGVLDWNAWTNATWFTFEPTDGTAPDTFWVSLAEDLKCPETCITVVDSICVYGNKGCALNSPQWVKVELRLCPTDTVICDSLCGTIYDCSCLNTSGCLLTDVHVELWDSYPDGSIIDSVLSVNGTFCFDVEPGVEYDVRFWKKGYCTDVIEDWSCEDGTMLLCLNPLDFTPLPNWPYFTDYYSTNAQFVSGGLPWPIIPGDVIYATDPQGVICGVYWVEADGTYLIHVLGDDPKTDTVDEGAVPNDSITLWLNCECPVVAPDLWVNFGNFQFDALWDCENVPLCCYLCEGWNMWSYNRVLPDVTREAVLATIDLNYDAVRSGLCDYGSISWFEGRPVNDLVNVGPSFGYDIHMTADDTVCIEGELIDPTTPIYLCQGWNYIPYWPNDMDNLGHALQSLAGNYTFIFTMYCDYGVASWSQYREDNQLPNDLNCMEPCHGYWINMKSDDTLIYPTEPQGCQSLAKIGSSSSAGRVTATPMVADYFGRTSLSSGSVISVRNTAGTLIGETYVDANGAFLIHVYGDVPYTSDVEGAVHGESLTFEVNGMAASAGRELFWTDRDNVEIEITVDAAAAVPTEYSLLQNYPNPFNAGTVIPFVMKDASQWTLTVYNIMGQTVRTFDGFDAAGTVNVDWNGLDRNGENVPSGVYFYRVTTEKWSATKKMTLLR